MNSSKTIFISAGEQSGDMHGSSLINEIKKITDISFSGLGGDMMISEGLNEIAHISDLSATGIAEVARKYVYFKQILEKCASMIYELNPAAVILIDYPGFNLRLAKRIRKDYKGKVIYYISPQVWAWNEKRVHSIKKNIDKMLVVFPFEVDFYSRYGILAEYVGHPLVKRINEFITGTKKKAAAAGTAKKVTLLPGSRNDEVKHHLPVLLETINLLREDIEIDLYISKAQTIKNELFQNAVGRSGDYTPVIDNLYTHIYESDLVMTKAGTSTMECSLLGTPFLIFYKTYPVNYFLLKPLVKIQKIGIVNILSGKDIIKEFIQNDFTPKKVYDEAKKILTDSNYSNHIRNNLKYIWNVLGPGDASQNAAKKIYQMALA